MSRDAVDDLSDLDEATVAEIRAAVDHQERRELQRLAKLRGIKANQKTQVLVEELGRRLAAYDAGARSATPPPPTVPVPVPAAPIPAPPPGAQAPITSYTTKLGRAAAAADGAEEMAALRRQHGPRRGDRRGRACGFALLRRASDAPPAPPPAPRSAMTRHREALAGARDAGRRARARRPSASGTRRGAATPRRRRGRRRDRGGAARAARARARASLGGGARRLARGGGTSRARRHGARAPSWSTAARPRCRQRGACREPDRPAAVDGCDLGLPGAAPIEMGHAAFV